MISPLSSACVGGKCPEEKSNSKRFHVVLKPICVVYGFTKMILAFASHFGHDRSKCSAVSSSLPECGQLTDVIWPMKAARQFSW